MLDVDALRALQVLRFDCWVGPRGLGLARRLGAQREHNVALSPSLCFLEEIRSYTYAAADCSVTFRSSFTRTGRHTVLQTGECS